MKFIFFGTPRFAALVLERIMSKGLVPAAVVCNPDAAVGRKKVVTAPEVKQLILRQVTSDKAQGIKILQPEKLDTSFKLQIASFKPDLFVLASYGKIIPQHILAIPRLGTIGVHGSLLPLYRGASPIQTAILNGDETTGISLYLMGDGIDDGPVLAKAECRMENGETYTTLLEKLAGVAGDLLVETIPKFLTGEITPQPQDDTKATYTKKFTTQDGFVSEDDLKVALAGGREKAVAIDRKIRALGREPGVWTIENGKRKKLLEAEVMGNTLKLKKIQIEGKTPQRL